MESWSGRGGREGAPQDALLNQEKMKEKDESNIHLFVIRCGYSYRSQKLDELVKNGNCSSPVRGEGGARGGPFPLTSTTSCANACATFSFTYSSVKMMKQNSSFSAFVFLWFPPPQRECH